jgi:hypothetical protein
MNLALVGAVAVAVAALAVYRRRRARSAPTATAAPKAAPDQVALETSATLAPPAPADPFAAHVAEPAEPGEAVEVTPAALADPFAAHIAEPVEADDPFAVHVAEPAGTEGTEPGAAEEIDEISWVEPPDADAEPAVEPADDAAAEAAELPEIITEPGWYLPGEADVTWATIEGETAPPAEAPSLDAWSAGEEAAPPEAEVEAEAEIAVTAAEEIPVLDAADDFDPTVGWGATPDPQEADLQPSPYADLSLDVDDPALSDLSLGDGVDEVAADELAIALDVDDAAGEESWLGEPEPVAPGSPALVTAAAKGPVTIVVDPLSGWMPAGPPDADGPDGQNGWELVVKLELRPLPGPDEPR